MFRQDDKSFKLSELTQFGRIGEVLAEILEHMIERLDNINNRLNNTNTKLAKIEEEVVYLKGGLDEARAKIDQLMKDISDIRDTLIKHDEKLAEIIRRQNNLEIKVGALSESYLSYRFIEELKNREKVIRVERNYIFNNEEIDALIECPDKVYLIEVKEKPRISDVGSLLAKADLYIARTGTSKKVIPVLVGVYVGREVEEYASKKNVLVYKY